MVELFVVATSKIMRCHYATVGMREGQALCSFCKEKSNSPCLSILCIFFLSSSKNSALPNNCCKLSPGDFCYFYPTHLYLWTRKHIQCSSPGPFYDSISALNHLNQLQVIYFFSLMAEVANDLISLPSVDQGFHL